jgi:hypothetical protein
MSKRGTYDLIFPQGILIFPQGSWLFGSGSPVEIRLFGRRERKDARAQRRKGSGSPAEILAVLFTRMSVPQIARRRKSKKSANSRHLRRIGRARDASERLKTGFF